MFNDKANNLYYLGVYLVYVISFMGYTSNSVAVCLTISFVSSMILIFFLDWMDRVKDEAIRSTHFQDVSWNYE